MQLIHSNAHDFSFSRDANLTSETKKIHLKNTITVLNVLDKKIWKLAEIEIANTSKWYTAMEGIHLSSLQKGHKTLEIVANSYCFSVASN